MKERGVDPVWVELDGERSGYDRGCIYVLADFDTAQYKALAGKHR